MPTPGKPGKSKAPSGFPPTTWVECDLTPEEKDDLKQRELSIEDTIQSLAGVIAEGFKVSFSYDDRGEFYGCYFTAPKDAFEGRTVCLSARAPSLEKALSVLLYKHFEKLKGDWQSEGAMRGKKDSWG